MPNVTVGFQLELSAVMWGILGVLSYIADCLRPGWPPKILAASCILLFICYMIGSIIKDKKRKPNV